MTVTTRPSLDVTKLRVGRIYGREAALRGLQNKRYAAPEVVRVRSVGWNCTGRFLMHATGVGAVNLVNMETSVEETVKIELGEVGTVRGTHHPAIGLFGGVTRGDCCLRSYDLYHEQDIIVYSTKNFNVTGLELSPTSDLFLSCYLDGPICLHDIRHPGIVGEVLPEGFRKATVLGNVASYAPDGRTFAATVGDDIKIFDVRQVGEGYRTPVVNSIKIGGGGSVQSIMYSPTGDLLAVKCSDNAVRTCSIPTGKWTEYERTHFNEQEVLIHPDGDTLSWSPTGILATGNEDGTITTWTDPAKPQLLSTSTPHPAAVGPISWNPKHQVLASGCYCLFLWQTEEEEEEEKKSEANPATNGTEMEVDSVEEPA